MDTPDQSLDPLPEPQPGASEGNEVAPWERQPGESAPAWAAFQLYRNLGAGRRSLAAVEDGLYSQQAEESAAAPDQPQGGHKKSPKRRRGSLGKWSREHRWVARAAAWDAELDSRARAAQVEAVAEMNSRHVAEARELQLKAVAALRALAAGDLEPGDVLRFLVEGSKLERLACGQPSEAIRHEHKTTRVMRVVERIVPLGARAGSGTTAPRPAGTARTGAAVWDDQDDGGGVVDALEIVRADEAAPGAAGAEQS